MLVRSTRSVQEAIRASHGFTLIELMIAVVLLSTAALALGRTLVITRQALAVSGKWACAAQLAAEAMEQVRAGQAPGPVHEAAEFARTVAVTSWSGHAGLQRIEVTVTWNDGESHSFGLVTLARR